MFEDSREKPIDISQLSDGAKEVVDKGLNLAENPFIDERPNCTDGYISCSEITKRRVW
jgi:hypothetical protein